MAIKRAIEEVDITQAFFPVEERTVGIEPFFGNFKSIPGYKAIVDSDLGTAISVVSKDYQLITNRDAYEIAVRLIPKLFEGGKAKDRRLLKLKYVIATYKSIQRSAAVMIARASVTGILPESTFTNISNR